MKSDSAALILGIAKPKPKLGSPPPFPSDDATSPAGPPQSKPKMPGGFKPKVSSQEDQAPDPFAKQHEATESPETEQSEHTGDFGARIDAEAQSLGIDPDAAKYLVKFGLQTALDMLGGGSLEAAEPGMEGQ